eukprot:TRINITY_DN6171_c0_g1_i2.p1 TRINITY_DN6171_c0_g1~~TRINITY_DN6171_c0_g1_i2.p1  ORF type:complete len:321 (-),score=41.28 TRINITY_DN6171_c0_g1_i2:251-1213(-)
MESRDAGYSIKGNGELVLVTGGAGFIGSHVVERLLKEDYKVRVLDNLCQGFKEWVPVGHPNLESFIEGDITNFETCKKAMEGVVGVFHLAAMSKVLPSLLDPNMIDFCTEQNVNGTLNVLKAAKAAGTVRKVVYSASSTFYGLHPVPHVETMTPYCQTPYALTKYVGEQYMEVFDRVYDLPTVSIRYFQVYGPRQPTKGTYAVVAGIFIDQMVNGQSLTIHGDGSQTRDFVHVRDVAEANVRAFCVPEARRMTINCGTGKMNSIKELADIISPIQTHTPARPIDLKATLADTTKCQKILKWVPEITFYEGIDELLKLAKK